MRDQPSFYANIPASVRYDDSLTPNAKLLYGEITALCSKEGYCWASNAYFAELYRVSAGTISEWVRTLRAAGHITYAVKENNTRQIFLKGVSEKPEGGIGKSRRGVSEKPEHITTVINTTITTSNNSASDYSSDFEEFWKEYPKKVGKGAAWSAWKKAKPPALADLLATLTGQRGGDQWRREQGRFIPNPATWINQRRWDDEVEEHVPDVWIIK